MSDKIAVIFYGWPHIAAEEDDAVGTAKLIEEKGYEIIDPSLPELKYTFSYKKLATKVKRQLHGREPSLIVGLSMGGLAAVPLAIDYPKARLILVATGPYLKPQSVFFLKLINLFDGPLAKPLTSLGRKMPKKLIGFIYQSINPLGESEDADLYQEDKKRNIAIMSEIPYKKQRQLIQFVKKTNNVPLLTELKNQTLIISGKNDILMPPRLGKMLQENIKNSQLILTQGSHFNVLTQKNIEILDDFLN